MASLIMQANSWHQTKETQQLKPPQKPKRWPTCKRKVEEKKKRGKKLIGLLTSVDIKQQKLIHSNEPLANMVTI